MAHSTSPYWAPSHLAIGWCGTGLYSLQPALAGGPSESTAITPGCSGQMGEWQRYIIFLPLPPRSPWLKGP